MSGDDEMVMEERLKKLEKSLNDNQKMAVLATIGDVEEYNLKKKYLDESIYIQLDPLNIAQKELVYRIETEDADQNQYLGVVYGNIIDGVGLFDWIEKQIGIPAAYAKELVSVRTNFSMLSVDGNQIGEIGANCLKIEIIQIDEESCETLSKTVKTYIDSQTEKLVPEVGEHKLTLLSENFGFNMNTDLMAQQIYRTDEVNDLAAKIVAAKAAFTEKQQQYYKLLAEQKGWEEELDQEDNEKEQISIESPSVSKKYVLMGVILFAFGYIGILFLMYLFNSKLRVFDELQDLYHIPQIGLIVKDSNKIGLDKWIDNLHYFGRRRFTAEQSMELTATAVKIAVAKNKINSVCFMGCTFSAGAGLTCENLKITLEKEGINVTILDNVLYDADAMERVDDIESAVLVEKAGSTLYNEIASEIQLLKRQNITILGGIIVE